MFGATDVEALMSALGWAVVHFVWQGALVGLIAALILFTHRRASASVRYAVCCLAMACCAVMFVATAVYQMLPLRTGPTAGLADLLAGGAEAVETGTLAGSTGTENPAQVIAWVWAIGVLLCSGRFAMQWLSARRLKVTSISQPDPHWLWVFETLKAELGVGKAVRILRSGLAETPMVIGWFSPVVLVPASAFTSLTPEQLRAVLVHELTHIRRYDHWVNAAQVLIETALFFHPVIWWLSSRVRLEREHCCDDAAVCSAGHPIVFAEALAQLESLRLTNPQAVLAANGGSLMNRISRILGTRPQHIAPSTTWRTVTALTAGVLIATAGIANAAAPMAVQSDPVMKQLLKDAVAAGMSPDQARVIYDAMVFPGSQAEAKMDEELARLADRINGAVESGRISAEDGKAKLENVRREFESKQDYLFATEIMGKSRSEIALAQAKEEMQKAVAAGKISQEDADKRLEGKANGLKEREAKGRAMRERYKAAEAELQVMVEAGKVTQEQADQRLKRLRASMANDGRGQGDQHKPDWAAITKRIKDAVKNGDMTREQAKQMLVGIRERMAAGNRDDDGRGGDEMWKKVAGALAEAGIPRDKIRDVMGAMKRIVHEIREEGEEFELNERMLAHLTELGLDREQIGLVIRLSHRVAMAGDRDDADRGDEMWKKVAGALAESGIPRDKIREVMGAMKRIVHEIREEGEEFELNERMLAYLTELGLDREQIALVIRLSQRVAMAGDRDRGDVRADWEGVKKRIEAAVKNGDITREQADERYRQFKERMGNKEKSDGRKRGG